MRARLAGRWCKIDYPDDKGYLSDIINVWLDDEYGLHKLVSTAPETIVDVGANIGLFSLWARNCFPQARIFAYEPNPRIYQHLERNVNPLGVHCCRVGIADTAGRATMVDLSDSRRASTHRSPDGDVTLIPLSEAIAAAGGTVDILKLDCEGAEWEILRAAEAFERVRSIRMEYHLIDGHAIDDIVGLANRVGFRVINLVPYSAWGIMWLERVN